MDAVTAMLDSATCDLDIWLTPFLDVLGRKTRRTWTPFYVCGLLGPSERKSLQPAAFPRRSYRRAEQHARGDPPPLLYGLPVRPEFAVHRHGDDNILIQAMFLPKKT